VYAAGVVLDQDVIVLMGGQRDGKTFDTVEEFSPRNPGTGWKMASWRLPSPRRGMQVKLIKSSSSNDGGPGCAYTAEFIIQDGWCEPSMKDHPPTGFGIASPVLHCRVVSNTSEAHIVHNCLIGECLRAIGSLC
jgi:hypothetical protein